MTVRPRLYVDAPSVSPLPYGLWSVVQDQSQPGQAGPHWRNGVQFEPDQCEAANSTVGDCPPPEVSGDPDEGRVMEPTGQIRTVGTDPITVYAWVDCGPVGGVWQEATEWATAALTAGEARAVEHAFWTGQVTHPDGHVVHPHLAADVEVTDPGADDPEAHQTIVQPAAVVPQDGPLDIVEGIGVLEGAMAACYPGVPVLHVPRRAVASMVKHGLVSRQGPQLRTLSGSLVAAGSGYPDPGPGPDGTAPDYPETWIYATGSIGARRSGVTVTSREVALDRATNRLVLIPQRTYTLGWDCCLFAARVYLGGIVSGIGNSQFAI